MPTSSSAPAATPRPAVPPARNRARATVLPGVGVVGVVGVGLALTLAALLALVLVAPPVAAVEAQGIRLDPAEPSALGAGSVLRPALAPGGAATYDLTLHNQRDEPVEVLVYGADVTGDEVASGTDNVGVGSWIAAAEPRIRLEAGGGAVVAVTVARPDDDGGGGTGAIVAQLSEQSRQDLGLDFIRRAALRVEVAADGSGRGLHAAVTGQDPSRGLVPGVLTVEVTITNPGDEAVEFDGSLHVLRRLGADATHEVEGGTLAAGEQVVRRVQVELPWYGVTGRLRAEAASVAVTASSPTARLVVIPPWLVLPLLGLAAWAMVRLRRVTTAGHDDDDGEGEGDDHGGGKGGGDDGDGDDGNDGEDRDDEDDEQTGTDPP